MTLSALIKKGGLSRLATMTPATIATQETAHSHTVAPVATVAVAVNPQQQQELLPDEETSIRKWLEYIEETNPTIIADVLNKCRDDIKVRKYLLNRSEEVPVTVTNNELLTCGAFDRIDHPSGHF